MHTGAPLLRPTSRSVHVLFDTRRRHFGQNPYISILADALQPEVHVFGFSWAKALFGRYDLVHLHWPEYLLRPKSTALQPLARILLAAWLVRLRVLGTPVVQTAHNRNPSIPLSARELRLLRQLQKLIRGRIWLSATDVADTGPPTLGRIALHDTVILHGSYKPWLDAHPSPPASAAKAGARSRRRPPTISLLCFGILRPYKSFEQVIRAVAALPSPAQVILKVIGSPADPAYLELLMAEASRSPDRVTLCPHRLEDAELHHELLTTDLVVVPYHELANSGVALLALSANRPVAVRAGAMSTGLAAEFGTPWVYQWHGTLTTAALAVILTGLSQPRPPLRFSEERSWTVIARQHSAYYASLTAAARQGM
jgi:beta-1,4-mannosyltransferase